METAGNQGRSVNREKPLEIARNREKPLEIARNQDKNKVEVLPGGARVPCETARNRMCSEVLRVVSGEMNSGRKEIEQERPLYMEETVDLSEAARNQGSGMGETAKGEGRNMNWEEGELQTGRAENQGRNVNRVEEQPGRARVLYETARNHGMAMDSGMKEHEQVGRKGEGGGG